MRYDTFSVFIHILLLCFSGKKLYRSYILLHVINSTLNKISMSISMEILLFLAELQQSCSRLMFWRKAGGRMLAYLR
jgi:hypothetical protein